MTHVAEPAAGVPLADPHGTALRLCVAAERCIEEACLLVVSPDGWVAGPRLSSALGASLHPDLAPCDIVDRVTALASEHALDHGEQLRRGTWTFLWLAQGALPRQVAETVSTLLAESLTTLQKAAIQEAVRLESLERVGVGIFVIDQRFRIVSTNREMQSMVGLDRQSLKGVRAIDLVDDIERDFVHHQLQRLFNGETSAFSTQLHLRTRTALGPMVQITLTTLDTPHGRLVIGDATDITATKDAELRIRESEERYRSFLEHSADGVWRVEFEKPIPLSLSAEEQVARIISDGFIAECNELAAQLYGFRQPSDVLGRRLAHISSKRGIDRGFWTEFIESGHRLTQHIAEHVGDDGSVTSTLSTVVSVIDDGQMLRLWGLQRDFTEEKASRERQRELEKRIEQGQRLESLGVLAGGLAHDFNNILMAIMGQASLAEMDAPEGSDLHDRLDEIRRAAEKAAELTNQMLAYSGQGRFSFGEHDLAELVSNFKSLIDSTVPENASVEYNLQHTSAVRCDADQMKQVLVNLVTNSCEAFAGEAGTITIDTCEFWYDSGSAGRAHLAADLSEGLHPCIRVRDNGPGMDPEVAERAFDPFFSTRFTGRGLGLSVVHGIVRGHGGSILVDSSGDGTTVTIILPNPTVTKRSSGRTILVVDDDPAVRSLIVESLKRINCEVIQASDGRHALDIWNEQGGRIDLVLLDMTMPVLSGTDVLKHIRETGSEAPVLMMSGYLAEEVASRIEQRDNVGFLQKPFDPRNLINQTERFLEK